MKRFNLVDPMIFIAWAFVLLTSLYLLIVKYDITGVVRDTVQS